LGKKKGKEGTGEEKSPILGKRDPLRDRGGKGRRQQKRGGKRFSLLSGLEGEECPIIK